MLTFYSQVAKLVDNPLTTNSFVQFAELKLCTIEVKYSYRCSSANCMNECLINAVPQTAPIIIV